MNTTSNAVDVSAELKNCITSLMQSGVEPDLIHADTNLLDIGIDSMSMTELLLLIEERFKLTLSPEELSIDVFTRFGRLVEFVQSKLGDA